MSDVNIPEHVRSYPKSKIYTIVGEPVPLARPRFSTKGEKPVVWDSQLQAKTGASLQLRSQHKSPLFETPIHMNIAFYFGTSKKHTHGKPHAQRPDLDNCIKFLLDISNGIIYKDDALVVSLFASKYYDNYERTEFTITEIRE